MLLYAAGLLALGLTAVKRRYTNYVLHTNLLENRRYDQLHWGILDLHNNWTTIVADYGGETAARHAARVPALIILRMHIFRSKVSPVV